MFEPLHSTAQPICALEWCAGVGPIYQMAHVGIAHQFDLVFAHTQSDEQLHRLLYWATHILFAMEQQQAES